MYQLDPKVMLFIEFNLSVISCCFDNFFIEASSPNAKDFNEPGAVLTDGLIDSCEIGCNL